MANTEYNEDVHHSSFLQNQTVEDENRVSFYQTYTNLSNF